MNAVAANANANAIEAWNSVLFDKFVKYRATRYKNDRFEKFLDDPPAWYGISEDKAARIIADGIERRKPLVVFGIEKAGWWLKRLWPAAAFALTRRLSRRVRI